MQDTSPNQNIVMSVCHGHNTHSPASDTNKCVYGYLRQNIYMTKYVMAPL